jgi:hypothetical protein
LPLVIREYLKCIDVNLNDKENKKIEDFLIEVAKKLEDKKKVRKVDIKEIIKCVKEKGIIITIPIYLFHIKSLFNIRIKYNGFNLFF